MKAVQFRWNLLASGLIATTFFLLGSNAIAQEEAVEAIPQSHRAYVMTNQAGANTVVVYSRAADGSLTEIEEVPTGGFGSGPGILPPPLPPFPGPIPLDSQDALIVTQDGRFLLTVNADSNDISSFAITKTGIKWLDKVPSGGSFPVSITEHHGLVYVANAGESPDELIQTMPNIVGFRLSNSGKLTQIPNSTQIAGDPDASAANILFSPNGRQLVMTQLNGNNVVVFQVGPDGRAGERVIMPANSRTPFGIQFRPDGVMALVETNDTSRRLAVNNGASLSTYKMTNSGVLEPVSKAVPSGETAACWVRFTPDGTHAFAINAGSGSISLYNISKQGVATVQTAVSVDTGGAFSLPIDSDISPDGKFLYVVAALAGLNGTPVLPLPATVGDIQIYQVGSDGSLTLASVVTGLPYTTEGIVIR